MDSSAWLKLCIDGCCRLVAKPVRKKEPISIETLKALVYKYAGANCLLGDLCITTLVILSFVGFLRINGALKLRRSDIIFYPSPCSISIRNSKTDVYRLGNSLAIARTGTLCCPVHLLGSTYWQQILLTVNQRNIFFVLLCVKVRRSYTNLDLIAIRRCLIPLYEVFFFIN